MLLRKIDTVTGNFLEDVIFESHPFLMEERTVEYLDELDELVQYGEWVPVLDAEGNPQLDPQYIEDAPAQGFYCPRWNGLEWVEGGVAPEPTVPEPQVPTMEQMAIALMQTQAELEATTEALDFLIMGGF